MTGPETCVHVRTQRPQNMTLFRERVFAGVMKDLEMRSPWLIQVDPKSRTSVFIRDRQREMKTTGETQTWTGMSDTATAQETWSHGWKRQEGLSLEGVWPCNTWVLDLWPPGCDRADFCGFNHLACGALLWLLQDIFTNSGYYKTCKFCQHKR